MYANKKPFLDLIDFVFVSCHFKVVVNKLLSKILVVQCKHLFIDDISCANMSKNKQINKHFEFFRIRFRCVRGGVGA